jgi:tetratricopeptide (TPR) repeat protein
MEWYRQLDAAGLTSARRALMKAIIVLLILILSSLPLRAQNSISEPRRFAEIKQLLTEERWLEIIQLAETESERSADLNYYYGTALARLKRWDDARKAFLIGLNQQPEDKRFPLELAGVSFKQKNYADAAHYLRRALRLDPADTYAHDFLASVYFLQGNLEAALKHWNRVSKPHIEAMRIEPAPEVDPVLLDHAFALAPASTLSLAQLRTTKARVDGLNIFTDYRFDLEARPDGKFDAVFRARERNGWGSTKWEGLISLLRGIPFQAIHPEYFNIGRRAINFESLIRWDAEKRRLWANLSGPFSEDPKWRYRLALDMRNENWDIRSSASDTAPLLGGFNMRRQAVTADITSFVNGRFDWSTGFELSHRDFRDVNAGVVLTPQLLARGLQLKHLGELNYELVSAPERRLSVGASASSQIGRIWSQPSQAFAKFQSSLRARWLPQAEGDDYEMQAKIYAGRTFGEPPFDELFILGVERDNDLWLRSHVGTRDGRKGSAPLGRNYLLTNWELDKNLYSNALLSFKLGPFVDSGKITGSSTTMGSLGSKTWLWDVGVQTKVRMLGVGLAFSYGKDLRSGNNAFYISTFR